MSRYSGSEELGQRTTPGPPHIGGRWEPDSPAYREARARLLLVGDATDQLIPIRSLAQENGFSVNYRELQGLETIPLVDTEFDLVLMCIRAPTPSWQQWAEAIKLRRKIPVLCVLPLPLPEQLPAVARLAVDEVSFAPIQSAELLLRLRLVVLKAEAVGETAYPFVERRRGAGKSRTAGGAASPVRRSLVVHDREKGVTINGRWVRLSPKEYQLLLLLASDPGRVFSVREIAAHLWPKKRVQSTDVQQYIRLLRKKIEEDPGSPAWVVTVAGFGYRLAPIGED